MKQIFNSYHARYFPGHFYPERWNNGWKHGYAGSAVRKDADGEYIPEGATVYRVVHGVMGNEVVDDLEVVGIAGEDIRLRPYDGL